MTRFDTARQRYLDDPYFRQLVDVLTQGIQDLQVTPNEVRSAAGLACLHFGEHTGRPMYIATDSASGPDTSAVMLDTRRKVFEVVRSAPHGLKTGDTQTRWNSYKRTKTVTHMVDPALNGGKGTVEYTEYWNPNA